MASTPLSELAAIARDVRKVGWKKLPTGLDRVSLVIVNTRAHLNQQPSRTALRFGRLAKYMETEVLYILDPTVDEFIDLLRHFLTEVTDYLFIATVACKIGQDLVDEKPLIRLKGGSVDPDLLFDLLNCKNHDSRVCFALDGVNNTSAWVPSEHGVDRDGVLFIAPYPDPAQASLDQFDSSQESLFAMEMSKIIKTDPTITGKNLATALTKELQPFGMRVFVSAYPPEMASELSFAV